MSAIPTDVQARTLLAELGVPEALCTGGTLAARSPIDGRTTGAVHEATPDQVKRAGPASP